jgi:hypothetical protein
MMMMMMMMMIACDIHVEIFWVVTPCSVVVGYQLHGVIIQKTSA